MAKVGFYVSEAEKAWMKSKGPGWFREMLRRMIGNDHPVTRSATERNAPVQITPQAVDKAFSGLKACPKCGALITEKQTAHGKCGWVEK